jgi:inorganic pyrophosphatase
MLKRFFEDYKTLEGKEVEVDDIMPPEPAHAIIEDSMRGTASMRQRGELIGR